MARFTFLKMDELMSGLLFCIYRRHVLLDTLSLRHSLIKHILQTLVIHSSFKHTHIYIGWGPIKDVSQGLTIPPGDQSKNYHTGRLYYFAPGHIVMGHNIVLGDQMAARQLWRRFDVETKMFGHGMEAGYVWQ